ncbi:MAG: DNA recombination protein RmuC [Acidobacteria bacterium]|nr:MAG: DNA recombination protein RmuC [Acidobacteriota bacterium]
MPLSILFPITIFVTGVALGAIIAALWARGRMAEIDAGRRVAEANLISTQGGLNKMTETFQAAADTALRATQQSFLDSARSTLEMVRTEMTGEMTQRQTAVEGVVRPLSDSLARLDAQIHEIESARQRSFGGIEQQLQNLSQRELELQKETASLSTALRAPQVRGRWGELTLRRVAELAGMVERCDFAEQETHTTENGRIRPDVIVRLPGQRTVVVDAKVPLTAFLDAAAATSEADRHNALMRHSQQLIKHIDQLSAKSYWNQFQPAPEFVVLFLPGDHFFSAALEYRPTLIEDAARLKILVATPTTLIAILKGVAYGWRQEQLAQNAEEIRRLAAELFDRIVNMQSHFNEIGRSLDKSVDAYNRSVGSLESRLYPTLRRIRELGATSAEEPPLPDRVNGVLRVPTLFEVS